MRAAGLIALLALAGCSVPASEDQPLADHLAEAERLERLAKTQGCPDSTDHYSECWVVADKFQRAALFQRRLAAAPTEVTP